MLKRIGVLFCLMQIFAGYIQPLSAQIITTFAGNTVPGFSGDGGYAATAELQGPTAVAIDTNGNILIADQLNNRIRKVKTTNGIYTIAGNGTAGFSGDKGAATLAELNNPSGIAVDRKNNIYIADMNNNRIRKINDSGKIYTIAGNGTAGYFGDGGQATAAKIYQPAAITVDTIGNIYIADLGNNCIRKVDTSGIISTYAGSITGGYFGDGGAATAAEMNAPAGVAYDKTTGSIYISDAGNQCIRKVSAAGIITTYAGNGTAGFSGDGMAATAAEINNPAGLAVDLTGDLFIADMNNSRVREISPSGIIITIAGSSTVGFSGDNGLATNAKLNMPAGLAWNNNDFLYIADAGNNDVRLIVPCIQPITGPSFVCIGSSIALYDGTAGGRWSASNTDAVVSSGHVRGVSTGTDIISYSVTNACGAMVATYPVSVRPVPNITGITDQTLCSGIETIAETFTSSVSGTVFSWRNSNVHLGLSTSTGTGDVAAFMASDTSKYIDSMVIVVSPVANGCTGKSDSIWYHIKPVGKLISSLKDTICSNEMFNYSAEGNTTGITFNWSRPLTQNISNAAAAGTIMISESLVNDTIYPVPVSYIYTLTLNGCQNVEDLNVIVNPMPQRVSISTHSPSTVCANTLYQNFGTSVPPAAGVNYNWQGINAIIWKTGAEHQYCLVNFPAKDTAYVVLSLNFSGYNCYAKDSFKVNVNADVAVIPNIDYSFGTLICLDNAADSFQWGTDNMLTLDSSIVAGQTNQNYYVSTLDSGVYYWVITKQNGCKEKTYYNTPTVVTSHDSNNDDELVIYPNPVSGLVDVSIKSRLNIYNELIITDITGRCIRQMKLYGNQELINMDDLPSGMFTVTCYGNGLQSLTRLIIKK